VFCFASLSQDGQILMPTLSPARRLAAIGVAVAVAVLGLAAYASYAKRTGHAVIAGLTRPQPADRCAHAYGPFSQHRAVVRQRNGRLYIPYGVTVSGLAHAGYQRYLAADGAQIRAAAVYWCANTVRIQVAPDNLVGASGTGYSKRFMTAIKAEVAAAQRYGLVPVLCAQTEDVGHQSGPTAATFAFWHAMAGVYGRDRQVAFDLFNEPRDGLGTAAQDWRMWQWGGTSQGTRYFGMQQLVEAVRYAGARNLLWVEAPRRAGTLAGLAGHLITNGGPLMYAVHHPAGAHDPAAWWRDFGWLAAKRVAPVVVGEWSNYAAAKSECWPDAPTAVPQLLRYLGQHGIGMTVWSLRPGVMVASGNLSQPTTMTSAWACENGLDQGAGRLVMDWFRQQNRG
jgi:hypothetical protein